MAVKETRRETKEGAEGGANKEASKGV